MNGLHFSLILSCLLIAMGLTLFITLFAATTLVSSSKDPVTCGSVVKLVNVAYSVRLHSPDVKYGMGSGQQSVTGVQSQIESGSHWQIKGNGSVLCPRGKPVACGQIVRLENLEARKNLHSHKYRSPISNGQEVSVFGDGGEGDFGDHWEVICSEDLWYQDREVMFLHEATAMYLEATGHEYHDPIAGHVEIACSKSKGLRTTWKTAEGIFIQPSDAQYPEPTTFHHQTDHSEL